MIYYTLTILRTHFALEGEKYVLIDDISEKADVGLQPTFGWEPLGALATRGGADYLFQLDLELQQRMASLIDDVPSTPLPTILNFRDVGQTINTLQRTHVLREGLIYRSARLDDASSSDRSALTSRYGIKSIIDLRSTNEHLNQAKKRDANAKISASTIVPKNDEKAADVVKIPGIDYHEINLNGGAFAKALLWKLRWSSLTKLVSLMAIGYRNEAISILGTEVMAPKGLIGLGKETLDHSFAELHRVFSVIADAANYPILIHCTQGKDRTGLVVMLLLLLLDVTVEPINADYMASERELESEKEARMKEITAIGLNVEFAGCPKGFVEEMVRHINEKYGNLGGYLNGKVGLDPEVQKKIRTKLRANSVDKISVTVD